jgi:hypothetical protein
MHDVKCNGRASLETGWRGTVEYRTSGASMAGTIDERLLSASDAALRVAEAEAAKADESKRAAAAAEAEKKALIESFQKVPSLSVDEKIERAASIIQRAVNNGLRVIIEGGHDFHPRRSPVFIEGGHPFS